MSHEHERPVEPFSDLHVEHGHVRATLLHDPTVEGLDMALYLDGSGSMSEEYANPTVTKGGSFWWWLFGVGTAPTVEKKDNLVEPQARWMLEYLSTKDRNGKLRVAYWATGKGNGIQLIGEVTGAEGNALVLPGPDAFGNRTVLAPAIQDYLSYFKQQVATGSKQGCAVFLTDGAIHDVDAVKRLSAQVARDIQTGRIPRVNFILVGVGEQVNEEQLEDICHEEYEGVGHLWCHRVAEEIQQVAELVAVLVDETMTVGGDGVVYDDKGQVLKRYEGRLPAVLEFEVPEGCSSFTLEIGGNRYTQPLPEEDEDHHDEDETDEKDHH